MNEVKILRLHNRATEVLDKHCKHAELCKTCKYFISKSEYKNMRCSETDYFAQHNIMIYTDKKNERHILTLTDKEKIAVRNLYKYCSGVQGCNNCKRYKKVFEKNKLNSFLFRFLNSCGVSRVLYERRVREKYADRKK